MNNHSYPTDNTLKNLALIAARQSRLAEQRLIELYDLAAAAVEKSREYVSDGMNAYELLSALSAESLELDYPADDGTPDELLAVSGGYSDTLRLLDRAVFSALYASGAAGHGLPVGEDDLLPSRDGDETFIYFRNSLADEAFDVFSQEFDDPRVRYGATLADCVRAVTSGECRFCLLPLEEKGGSRLPTVAELIYRGDLKINAVTPVFGFDGGADLKYALLSRDFLIPKTVQGDDRYLEIRVNAETNTAELFAVINCFKLSLYRVNTVSFVTEGEVETYLSIVLRDGGEGFAGLLVYLSLFCEDFTPVGIYKNLE